MYTNFDTQWQLRCRALTENHNPMSDERWQAMVTRAYGSERERPEAEKKGQRLLKRHIWRTAAAACLILLVWGTLHLHSMERPSNVKYSGQSVRFICNNQCNAQSTIAYFDNYIGKKGSL